jgi:glyoxylase-like metal-dependent hydrolase (beta-lactamase superfamily II)
MGDQVWLAEGIRRVRAGNASAMTGTGTNTYLIGEGDGVCVLDPGPALPAHFEALRAAIGKARVGAILVSHAHLDHSALARPLAEATGAPVLAFGDATSGRSAVMQALAAQGLTGGGEGVDLSFNPDSLLRDGDRIEAGGVVLQAMHTPGHMGGHLSFAVGEIAFTGDHVMGWSTSLVSPPDGDMGAYMASLELLSARVWSRFLPGHGEPIEAPAERLAALTHHRKLRETQILEALTAHPARASELAALLYTDTPPALLPAATRNVLAHLVDLHAQKRITTTGQPRPEAIFSIV